LHSSRGTKVPDRPEWLHEIKHDGYWLIIQREGKRVRLFPRNGHDWSYRFPLITEAALRNRISSFVIDGEAVLLGVDGRSDFNGLHSRKHNDEVQFYALDVLMIQAEDLRQLPRHLRLGVGVYRISTRAHLRPRRERDYFRLTPRKTGTVSRSLSDFTMS
jgi:bifunctional non-homologous end joining protein LigD